MHKDFYTSGFLYHWQSDQILLQNLTVTSSNEWSLFGGTGVEGTDAAEIFRNTISTLLQIKLTSKKINHIYTYFDETLNKNCYVFYAEVESKKKFKDLDNKLFSWFTHRQILKLPKAQQTGHDLMVGLRVIDAKERKRLGQHTFE